MRRQLALDRIRLPKEMTVGGIILGLLIPGLAVYIRGPRFWGKIALCACAGLFLVFIVWLGDPFIGFPFGNYAFGLMMSIHATGFVYYCSPFLRKRVFYTRILFTVAVLIGMGLYLYSPLRGAIQNRWLIPLQVKDHVVVVEKLTSASAIKRGDWIMYSLQSISAGDAHREGGAVRVQAGFGWGPVLAVAGDRVAFSTKTFTVNGVERPLMPHMPASGNLVVREKSWFIWPELGISGHGNASEAVISSTMLRLATVPEDQFVGKPFKRWFWRKQILQ